MDSELVEKRETFLGNVKNNYYEIGDPLLRFWYSFIFENQERIKVNGNRIYEEEKEAIPLFLSYGFEDVSHLYIEQLNEEGKLSEIFTIPPDSSYRI